MANSSKEAVAMTTINDLHERRRNILEIASAVRSLMSPEQLAVMPIAKVTHILLCDLCDLMTEHLADEHKSVYPTLLTNKNQDIQNMAWGLINNDRLLKPEFSDYKKRWLKDCEFQFTEDFVADTKEILETLQHRMDLEKNTVIPRLEDRHVLATA